MENEIFVIQQHRIEQHKEFEEAFKISQCNFTEYRTQLGKFFFTDLQLLLPVMILWLPGPNYRGSKLDSLHWSRVEAH